ncbi:MAG: hypothetical protein V1739_06670 [Candidatus Omnitrophota bacterium]
MKIKGVRIIGYPENTAFAGILISLLPIFQTRLDIVTECRLMLYGTMFFVTGICMAFGLLGLSEQGKLRPVIYRIVQLCWMGELDRMS